MTDVQIQTELLKTANRFSKINFSVLFQDVSHGEFRIMQMIIHNHEISQGQKGINVSEMAKGQKVSSPAVSKMLRSMEEKGWIIKKTDKSDRRNTYVYLTETGLSKCREAESILNTFTLSIINRMGKENMTELACLCNQLAGVIEEELPYNSFGNREEKMKHD